MANVSFSLDGLDQLRRMSEALSPKALDKATRSALAYAAKSVPPAAGKAIAARYSIGSRRAQQDISKPYLSAPGVASITFSRGKPPTAMQFKAKSIKPKGVRYRLYKGQDVTVRSGFFQKINGRSMAVVTTPNKLYRRDMLAGRLKPRQGLDLIHGPSIGSIVLRKGRHAEEIQAAMRDRLLEQFGKGLDRAMKAQGRGYGG